MTGYVANIERETLMNENFRKVLYTAKHSQLVVMSLKPNEEIGEEVHAVDQFFRAEAGEGKIILNGEEWDIYDGYVCIVPAGTKHNVINTSAEKPLKIYTLYMPPQHRDQTIHATKEEAMKDEEDHV